MENTKESENRVIEVEKTSKMKKQMKRINDIFMKVGHYENKSK